MEELLGVVRSRSDEKDQPVVLDQRLDAILREGARETESPSIPAFYLSPAKLAPEEIVQAIFIEGTDVRFDAAVATEYNIRCQMRASGIAGDD